MKTYQQMTPEERTAAIEQHALLQAHGQAVKARERALDAIQTYLKETKRKRPAPTMLFQYPGFDDHRFRELIGAWEQAEAAERRASEALYRRPRP